MPLKITSPLAMPAGFVFPGTERMNVAKAGERLPLRRAG